MRGILASQSGYNLNVIVCQSARGYYIGTATNSSPISRESLEYYKTSEEAEKALAEGLWTQRSHA